MDPSSQILTNAGISKAQAGNPATIGAMGAVPCQPWARTHAATGSEAGEAGDGARIGGREREPRGTQSLGLICKGVGLEVKPQLYPRVPNPQAKLWGRGRRDAPPATHQSPVEDTAQGPGQPPSTCPCHSSTACGCSGPRGLPCSGLRSAPRSKCQHGGLQQGQGGRSGEDHSCVLSRCSVVSDSSATPRTVAHQAPLALAFSGLQYWSASHSLLQGIFPARD